MVVVAKLAPACSPPARVASKPGSRRRARSCGSARSVPRVDRASCRARVVLVSARVVVSSPVDRPPGGSVLANDVARARRRSAMLAKRDLFALLLSAFAVYYGTRSESFVTFDRAWYLPLDPGGNAPRYDDPATRHGVDNHPPPPLFVDLNGDGEYEIIAASASAPEIRVFAQPANNGGAPLRPRGSRATDDVFAGDAARWEDSSSSSSASSASSFGAARTIAVASLIPENVRVSAGRRAIALAAGHLVPAGDSASSRSARKAVVVVVTEGWHVLCFDHNLRLMWERTLQESFPRHARVREVAVMVSDASMFEGDEGAVIVGGRVELGDVADAADEDPLSEELSDERMLGRHRGGVRASREEMARDDVTGSSTRLGAGVDASRHFDYHAFEGSTGAPRWRHESRDFHRAASAFAEQLVPQHNYRLDAAALAGHHYGEVACREFRESVVEAALPHIWSEREDTRFVPARFRRHRTPRGSRTSRAGGGPAAAPARGSEHATNPVARAIAAVANAVGGGGMSGGTSGGASDAAAADVGALVRGGSAPSSSSRPRATPAPGAPNVFVAHQEEGIEVVHLHSGRTVCKMLLAPDALHADVDGDGVMDATTVRGGGDGRSAIGADGDTHPACWARVTSGVPARETVFEGSVCRGAGGATRHGAKHPGGETLGGFATTSGVDVAPPVSLRRGEERVVRSRRRAVKDLVFLNSRGEVTCYSSSGARRWQQRTDATWTKGGGERASLVAFSPRVGGAAEIVLATGANRAVALAPSGYTLATIRVPARPIAPAVVADVDGDGLVDVVIRTESGTFCWRMRARRGAAPFAFLAGALAFVVAAAFVSRVVAAGGTREIARSTDWNHGSESEKDR